MKHSKADTIAAIATPLGVGGVGVIRISGDGSRQILSHLFTSSNGTIIESHRMLHGWLVDPKSKGKVDEVMACYMQSPKSFTGEDVVEFYCHGSMAVVQKALDLILASGAQLARRGEFTQRAFLNGKVDLAQAEAVLDLVNSQTAEGAGHAVRQLEGRLSKVAGHMKSRVKDLLAELEAGIDFPEDLPEPDYNAISARIRAIMEEIGGLIGTSRLGRIYRDGLATVIIGKPNVGKSCLLNALLGENRAIVTDIPGTTRDSIEEVINLEGVPLRVIDTAGIRHPKDKAEEFGVERTRQEVEAADMVLAVFDASAALDEQDVTILEAAKGKDTVIVLNKIDLGEKARAVELGAIQVYRVSALHNTGLDELKRGILGQIQGSFKSPGKEALIINARHRECLEKAQAGLKIALESSSNGQPADFITIDLKSALVSLGEITGALVSEDVINSIFEQFCVGK